MRTSILVHLARSLIAAVIVVIVGMFVPASMQSVTVGGTKILEITQHIIDYLPSSNVYRIGVGAYAVVISFFAYRASRYLTMLGTILWAVLWGAYIAAIALPNLQFFPLNAWAHKEAAQFVSMSGDLDLGITIAVAVLALIVVPITAASILSQIPFLRAREDGESEEAHRIEPEI